MEEFKIYQASGYLTKLVTDASDVRKTYEEISGSLVEFDTPISAPLAELVVDINPVQDLHGQDAPYPGGGGKNLLDPTKRTESSQNIHYYLSDGILLKAGTYTLSVSGEIAAGIYVLKKADASIIAVKYNGTTLTFTVAEDVVAYITIYYSPAPSDISSIKCQLELGSTATSFAPYSNICPITGWTGANIYHSGEDTSDPTTYTISWQDDAGTVYSGTYDFVSGVGVLTHKKVVITQSILVNAVSVEGLICRCTVTTDILSGLKPYGAGLCNKLSVYTSWASVSTNKNRIGINNPEAKQFVINKNTVSSYQELYDLVGSDGLEICIELAEPIEIQHTPQEINTLIGVNNIWADTGDVSVKYRTH